MSVLTYHFFKGAYPGGFIGVDIFFTFSGFLITALMIDEFNRSGQFKLLAFYRRRFYRIVPPLVLSILVVIPLTYLVRPDYIVGLGKQVAAALGFTTNYFEILTGGNYESKFIPHLFVHTWSLAVEMHFYIIWGLLIAIFTNIIRRMNYSEVKCGYILRWVIGLLSLILASESFLAMAFSSAGLTDYSPVYFSSLTHIFPFFVGAILASVTGIKSVTATFDWSLRRANVKVVVPLLLLVFAALGALGFQLQFANRGTYTGGILLASFLAAAAILLARVLHAATPQTEEPRWATFIADISYSMYLYHWPLFVIFSQLVSVPLAVLLTLAVGVPLSALSYYIIEPLIAGKRPRALSPNFNLARLGQVIVVAAGMLLILAGYTIKAAPQMTGLEQQLWIGSLKQSADQMGTTKQVIMTAVEAKTTAQHQQKVASMIPKGVSIIGDSVTLGARDYLSEHVPNSDVNAAGDRTMDLAYQVMMTAQKNKILRQNVVLCIGTNALDNTNQQLEKLISSLAPGHRLILVTPYDQRADPSWNSSKLADFERTLPAKYDYVTVADWQSLAAKHPEVFKGTDGVHFAGRMSGNIIYTQAINDGLKAAEQTKVKQ
ncbi:acyltransferase [Liquorilactobacillus capillatus DSM 19910]|uniref:Acyltransferase n=1 Tax=Liquorilactobacillus capillatus DSM 19910 TaxID=1423731 RepID=A0A0R1LZB7_9LACO|nr:acyltransferase [Liquorilactobacillus capillatus DSM 19910]